MVILKAYLETQEAQSEKEDESTDKDAEEQHVIVPSLEHKALLLVSWHLLDDFVRVLLQRSGAMEEGLSHGGRHCGLLYHIS